MLLDQLPFYFKAHEAPGNGGFPETLPFNLMFDDHLQMYRQLPGVELNDILKKVYASGTLVDGSISSESGQIYLKLLIDYINKFCSLEDKDVLEIGCGSGLLLIEMKMEGASVTGLEPGAHAKAEGLNDIEIIHDFFPSEKITGKFDLILQYGVLEHIDAPQKFLIAQKEYLKPSGKIIIAVPNCESFLQTGDISIFIHEHYNYFSRQSLMKVIRQADLYIEDISVTEGIILVSVALQPMPEDKLQNSFLFSKTAFDTKATILLKNISNLFERYNESSIAVYAPGRALNGLFIAKRLNTRLVDDNYAIHGKYLPCFSRPVENFKDLMNKPPECILIYSRTFGERIKEKCFREDVLKSVNVITLNDLDGA